MEEFRQEVDRHLTGKETGPWEISYFKLHPSQLTVVQQALEMAALIPAASCRSERMVPTFP